ncbi:MAG TPA: hypothetical protein VGX46_09980, partial [Vicinamibacterales bacterium]|nr:hypothetical protein [Vicinamibacterales bacterium]
MTWAPIILREIRGYDVRIDAGRDRGIAHSQLADPARRDEVTLKEHGRHAKHLANVVEPVARGVSRKKGIRVDIHRQQVPDRALIFGAVEAVKDGRPARLGCGGQSGTVEFGLQPRPEAVVALTIWSRPASGWHEATEKLLNDFFPNVGAFPDVRHVHCVKRQSSNLHSLVVARNTVLVEEGALLRDGLGGSQR